MSTAPAQHLDPAATARFLAQYPSAQQQHDALLAAFALAAAQALDEDEVLLRLENHGRHAVAGLAPNLSAGWMVCEHPLRIRGLRGADAGRAFERTQEALRELPMSGLGYGLLRNRGKLQDCALPRLGFTWRGRLDDVYRSQTRFRVLEIGAAAPALYANPAQPDLRLLAYLRGDCLMLAAEFQPDSPMAACVPRMMHRPACALTL